MATQVLMESAERDLKGLLARLSLGESVTLADNDGKPLALLVSLRQEAAKKTGAGRLARADGRLGEDGFSSLEL